MNVRLATLLKAAIEQRGAEEVCAMLQKAMRQKVAPITLEAFLRSDGSLRGAYERARNRATPLDARIHNLAACIRKMGLKVTFDTRHFPWSEITTGATVAVVIGIRLVTIREVSSEMKQRAVGARDMESSIELSNILNNIVGSSLRFEVHLLPPEMTAEAADVRLGELRHRKDLAAIVVLGSPVTNRMCDSVGRAILGGATPPALFRWSHRRQNSFLSDPKPCNADEEGIRCARSNATDFPRIPDDEVLRLFRAGKRGPYPDCGLLALDCREQPYLILAAGHGGCGTKACVRALSDQEEIENSLLASDRRLFVVVRAKRQWRSDPNLSVAIPVDDLDLPPLKGWCFEWLGLPPREIVGQRLAVSA